MTKNKLDNHKLIDKRLVRPQLFNGKKQKQSILIQPITELVINNKKISFYTPNSVSLCLSISSKEWTIAEKIFKELIEPRLREVAPYTFDEKLTSKLFNYFEHVQTSIIFSYNAVESFANGSIHKDFTYERTNNKGIKEVFDKNTIERWLSTSEKIKEILPLIYKKDFPAKDKMWNDFVKLESIRNDIIHPKTAKSGTTLEGTFFKYLMEPEVFKLIKSSFKLINYFIDGDKFHPSAPFGFGNDLIPPIEVDDLEERFQIVDKD